MANTKISKKLKLIPILTIISGISGILIHFYLTLSHFKLKYGHRSLEDSMCQISDTLNCTTALSSRYSELLSIPLSVWGFATNFIFTIIFIFFFLEIQAKNKTSADSQENTKSKYKLPACILAILIFAASVVMGIITLTKIKGACPFCVATYILSIVTLLGTLYCSKFIRGDKINIKKIAIALGSIALVSVATKILFMLNYNIPNQNKFARMQTEEWASMPTKPLTNLVEPLTKEATSGNVIMNIVEFADFRCSHCKNAAPKLKQFAASKNDVKLSFQAFPLDGACNKEIPSESGVSCHIAYAAYCAQTQDKGWQAHEWIFKRQMSFMADLTRTKEILKNMLKDLQLDENKYNNCISDNKTKEVIQKQAELGAQVGVKGTPAIYINGKLLNNRGIPLNLLLETTYNSIKENN